MIVGQVVVDLDLLEVLQFVPLNLGPLLLLVSTPSQCENGTLQVSQMIGIELRKMPQNRGEMSELF